MVDSFLQAIVTGLTHGTTLALGAYIGKAFFDRALSRDIERFKGTLNAELETHKANLAAESVALKHRLETSELEHRKAVDLLVVKRAEVIATAFAKLAQASRDTGNMVSMHQPPQSSAEEYDRADRERQIKAYESVREVLDYIQTHEIYFSADTVSKLLQVTQILRQAMLEYRVGTSGPEGGSPTAKKARMDNWLSANERLSKEYPNALSALGDDFRRILRVT